VKSRGQKERKFMKDKHELNFVQNLNTDGAAAN
jgi:hypothetical protein